MHLRSLFVLPLLALFTALPFETSAGAQTEPSATATVHQYKRFFFSDTEAKAADLKARGNDDDVNVLDLPLLETKEFREILVPFIGQPISTETVNKIASVIKAYLKKHDRLVVAVSLPSQDISSGDIRMAVAIGRYKDLKFAGNKWFSTRLLREKLGVNPGDEVRLSTLEEAVSWTNTNPFRRIQVLINELPKEPGKADLLINVDDTLPLRMAASYANNGNRITGENRYTASVQYGNVWGLDHQASYQYMTTDKRSDFEAHVVDYRMPLPWHHTLQASAIYAKMEPLLQEGYFQQIGETEIASLRYIAPVDLSPVSMELSAGLEYKQTNNNLYFGGSSQWNAKVDIFQVNFSATVNKPDTLGTWSSSINLNLSPGSVNSGNTDTAFQPSRNGARADYIYGSLLVQRTTNLPNGFQLFSNIQYQRSSANLTGSEQLSIGGSGSVRGYPQQIFSGDEGVVSNQELTGPVFSKKLPWSSAKTPPLLYRHLVFFDFGETWFHKKLAGDIPMDAIASAGIGIRCAIGNYFSLNADYGWQLVKTVSRPADRAGGAGHIRVTMSY